MDSHSTKCAYQPDELGSLQAIFTEVTDQVWFPRSAEIRENFAKYLFSSFPDGDFDAAEHHSSVMEAARRFCQTTESDRLKASPPEHPREDAFE